MDTTRAARYSQRLRGPSHHAGRERRAGFDAADDTTAAVWCVQVGRQILDSRGLPAVECEVVTYKGTFRASCPAGDFGTRPYETLELRDAGEDFHGQGVLRAVYNINHVRPATPLLSCVPRKRRAG